MNEEKTRLQKIIADRGYCSRRKAEELILDGLVKVDGVRVTELGSRFSDDVLIEIRGVALPPVNRSEFTYLLINKPLGVLTTLSDDRGRRTINELIPERYGRLFPVGRLDINTAGLLILTDDGDFANLVMHPSSHLEKTYKAKIEGRITVESLAKLRNGVMLDDGMTSPAKVQLISATLDDCIVEVTIYEGRKRQVRRMFEALGYRVIGLMRIQIGPIKLTLQKGQMELAKPQDILAIKKQCEYNRAHNVIPLNRK